MATYDKTLKYEFYDIDNNHYALYFYAGYQTDLPASPVEVDMPADTILGDFKISASYRDVPIGMPRAATMEFKINLDNLTGTTELDEFKTYIINGQSLTTRLINTKVYQYIPNRWKLYDITNSKTIYEGFQNVTPEYKWDLENNIMEIKTTDILTQITQSIIYNSTFLLTSQLPNYHTTNPSVLYENYFVGSYIGAMFKYGITAYVNIIDDMMTLFDNLINEWGRKYTRETTWTLARTTTFFDNITFYKRKTDTSGQKDTALTTSQIYWTSEIYDSKGNLHSGQLYDNDLNLYDYLKEATEGLCVKARYEFDTKTLSYNKIIDNSTGTTLNKDNISNATLTLGYNFIYNVIAHLDLSRADTPNEFENKSDGHLSDDSLETKLKFNNETTYLYNSNSVFRYPFGSGYGVAFVDMVSNELFYVDTRYMKVHEYVDIDLGTSTVSSTDATSNIDITAIKNGDRASINNWYRANKNRAGLGYTTTKAYLQLFGNRYQAMLECTLDLDDADLSDLGKLYIIDLNTITGETLQGTGKIGTDGILYDIEIDLVNRKSNCKFWIGAD